jgi:hypothetical protein
VDILVILGREENFRWQVCSTITALGLQNGACSTGGKKGVLFDTICITNWLIFSGCAKTRNYDLARLGFWSKAVLQ